MVQDFEREVLRLRYVATQSLAQIMYFNYFNPSPATFYWFVHGDSSENHTNVSWCHSPMVKSCYLLSVQPLDVIMEERICGPLKMRDTGFKVSKDRQIGWGFPSGVKGVQDTPENYPGTHIISIGDGFLNIVCFYPYLRKWSNLTDVFKWFETTT